MACAGIRRRANGVRDARLRSRASPARFCRQACRRAARTRGAACARPADTRACRRPNGFLCVRPVRRPIVLHAGDKAPTVDADKHPVAGVGIVNESFAREYFGRRRAIGQLASVRLNDVVVPMEIVGVVKDAAYQYLREPMRPTAYVPLMARGNGALMVRTSGDPDAAAANVRRVVADADPGVRIRHIGTQHALIQRQMVPERLLATLSGFFAVVAVLLAGV